MAAMIARGVSAGVAALTATVLTHAVAVAAPPAAPAVHVDQARIDGAFVTVAFTYSCPVYWSAPEKQDVRVASTVTQGGVRATIETGNLCCDGEAHQIYTQPFGGGGWRRFKPGAADVQAQLFKSTDMLRIPEIEETRSLRIG
jgi:hypothetical protein